MHATPLWNEPGAQHSPFGHTGCEGLLPDATQETEVEASGSGGIVDSSELGAPVVPALSRPSCDGKRSTLYGRGAFNRSTLAMDVLRMSRSAVDLGSAESTASSEVVRRSAHTTLADEASAEMGLHVHKEGHF